MSRIAERVLNNVQRYLIGCCGRPRAWRRTAFGGGSVLFLSRDCIVSHNSSDLNAVRTTTVSGHRLRLLPFLWPDFVPTAEAFFSVVPRRSFGQIKMLR